MTAPSQVDDHDVMRVWRETDVIPKIERGWLFDHFMPIGGDPHGPAHDGRTLVSALAAETQRLPLGLLLTTNRFRPPAMLAKIAVGIVSCGQLDMPTLKGSLRVSKPLYSLPLCEGGGSRDGVCVARMSSGRTKVAFSVVRRVPVSLLG